MPSEQTRKRLENQAAILHYIRRQGAVARSRIGNDCGIRKASVTDICRDLIDRKALRELEPGFYRSEVELSSDHWKALSISLSPDELVAGDIDHNGEIQKTWTKKVGNRKKPVAILALLEELITEALRSNQNYVGIGISIPGIVDVENGICLSAVNLGDWDQVSIVERLSENLPTNAPGITIENDAAAGLIANQWFRGFEEPVEDAIYFALGEGIGCAQLTGGKLARGQHFAAGEIGCLPSGDEGRQCSCGKRDCLQTYCGEKGLLQSIADLNPEVANRSLDEIGKLGQTNNEVSDCLQNALRPLTEKIATIAALSDPAAIITASEHPEFSKQLAALVRSGLKKQLGKTACVINEGLPPEQATLQGAAAAVFAKAFGNEEVKI